MEEEGSGGRRDVHADRRGRREIVVEEGGAGRGNVDVAGEAPEGEKQRAASVGNFFCVGGLKRRRKNR
jgi:hypothetical protein